MMRLLLVLVLLCTGGFAAASSLDLLGRIERLMLYPFDSRVATPTEGMTAVLWSREDVDLVLWHAPARRGAPTLVYFQGNAGHLGARSERFKRLMAHGFGIVALSPRGAGGSSGRPSEEALTQDAVALLNNLTMWEPTARPDRTILYGESLGTGVVIAALTVLQASYAGLILEAPFISIPEVARASGQVPESLLPHIRDRWPSLERSAALTAPLLVLHGTADQVIPIAQGQALFETAPSTNKDFLRVTGAGHSDLWRAHVIDRIIKFARDQSAR